MARRYTGSWQRRAALPEQRRTLWAGPDPQHREPDDDPNTTGRRQSWEQTGRAGSIPNEWLTSSEVPALDGAGSRFALLDREPQEHSYGLGVGAALPLRDSMRQNAKAHRMDRGASRARRYSAPARQDGDYHATLEQLPAFVAGSPDSIVFQQESDPRTSPNASIRGPGKRVNRWWDRTFWRQTWTTDYRPAWKTYAYTAPPAGPVPDGNQYTSPYPTAAAVTVRNVVTMRPQLRRNPREWDGDQLVDGSTETPAGAGFGFFSGGL